MGTFTGARRHVLHSFANSQSALMRKRALQFMLSAECPTCHGKRLRREALSVTFAGPRHRRHLAMPLARLAAILSPTPKGRRPAWRSWKEHPEKALVVKRIARDLVARLTVLQDLGLGYLSLDRGTPTLSPGELQRLRLATQVRSNLFGVVYVLDEPSAGLHRLGRRATRRARRSAGIVNAARRDGRISVSSPWRSSSRAGRAAGPGCRAAGAPRRRIPRWRRGGRSGSRSSRRTGSIRAPPPSSPAGPAGSRGG